MKRSAPLGLLVVPLLFVAGFTGCGQSSESARQVADLSRQVAVLKLHAQAARDWTSIATLQASYDFYVDTLRWDDAADLFASNASLEAPDGTRINGQDNIRAYLKGLGKSADGMWSPGVPDQPLIHIGPDGLFAKARWRASVPAGRQPGKVDRNELTLESEYAKEGGVWKIVRLHREAAPGGEPVKD